jgi:RNA polymerase sigma-70 factor, ECF subfamily
MEKEFLQLITTHKALIVKICHTYERDDGLRRDLFQEIVLNLWKAFPKYDASLTKWTTWAYRIGLNVAISQRRKTRLGTAVLTDELERTLSDAPVDYTVEDRLKALYQAIEQLNAAEKALILLYLDDIPHTDMADIIGISENNVGVKINRIKAKLKSILLNNG